MSDRSCRGCGALMGLDAPVPAHCGECPPWTCDGCGKPCSMAEPCSCWVSLEGMALADIKGLLALGDLSVDTPLTPASCGEQYGQNPDLCYHEPGHPGPHSNRWGTTWTTPLSPGETQA